MKGNGHNIHELTCIEAYLLSEKAGHPSHMHDYFWTQAEAIVRQRVAVVEVAVKGTKSGKVTKAKPTVAATPTAAQKKPAVKATKTLPDSQFPVSKKPAVAAPKSKAASPAKKQTAPSKTKQKSKSV